MKRYYEINKHNSTVLGRPGREFDWSKFCWDGSEVHIDRCECPDCKHEHTMAKAPLPFKDNYLIADNCEYLHVPYNWIDDCTIFRVRPNDSMYAGEIYRGKLIKKQSAVKRKGKWYWLLEFESTVE